MTWDSSKAAPFPRSRFDFFCSQIRIPSKDKGLVRFAPLGTQKWLFDNIEKGVSEGVTTFYILKARQVGATTGCMLIDWFWAFEHPGLLGSFILHKEEARDAWRQQIDTIYHEMPVKIKAGGKVVRFRPPIERHNRNVLAFANGSRLLYLIAGTQENRKGGLGRSTASNYVHASEVAFFGNDEDLKAFMSATSSIYEHRLQLFESTANGYNHFYDMYMAAKEATGSRAIFIGWWRDERNQFSPDHPIYQAYCPDKSVTPFERQRVKALMQDQGFQITMPQIAWYRWKLREEFYGDEHMMLQEFPWTEEDAFQATGSKYFSTESLNPALRDAKKQPFEGYRYRLGLDWEETSVQGWKHINAPLRIWEHSSMFGTYIIGCDPAFGSSGDADRTVISVWRAFADRLVQVAEYCSPDPRTYHCAWILAHLAGFYGRKNCHVILEITGPGAAVRDAWMKLRIKMQNIPKSDNQNSDLRNIFRHTSEFMYRREDSVGGGLAFQWKMTQDLKESMFAKFRDAFDLGKLVPRSAPLLEEMRYIVRDEGTIAAEGSHKDDRVIAAAMACEYWTRWVQPKMQAQRRTMELEATEEATGGLKAMDKLIVNYLQRSNINLAQPGKRAS